MWPGRKDALVLSVLDTTHVLPGGVELFKYDCEVLQHIPSDSIVPIVELIELDDKIVVMSRDTGVVPLRDILWRCGSLAVSDGIAVASGIVQALRDIHARNTVYKTLCPSTIFVSPDLARVQLGAPLLPFVPSDAVNKESVSPQMQPYLSPEQRARAVYTNEYRSDFYSLGVVLAEMFTGTVFTAAESHTSTEELLHSALERVPACLRAVIERLIAPEPSARYQSAAGILFDLTQCSTLWSSNAELRAGAADRSAQYSFPLALYGNDEELNTLRSTVRQAVQRGTATAVVITGKDGSGRTALLQQALCDHMGLTEVVTVTLEPEDAADDFMALSRIVEGLQECASSAAVPHSDIPSAGDPLLTEVLMAATTPIALVIDNLHYAHPALVSAVGYALRHLARRAVVLLATASEIGQPGEAVAVLTEVVRDIVPVHIISPSPLGLLYIRQMIVDTFGETLEDTLVLAELVLRTTEGNPRAVRESLAQLVEKGVLYFAFGRWQCDVHRLRSTQASSDVAEVLSHIGHNLPYRAFDELVTALAVDDIVDRVAVRELKKEIRAYRRQSRRNKDFVEEVQKFLGRIAALMPDYLFLFDIVQWQAVYTNRNLHTLLGYKDTDAVPPLLALMHPDDRTRVMGVVDELRNASDREVLSEEFRMAAADGSWQWFAAWITVFNRNADGNVQCIFGSASNITPRKEAQAALADSEKRLSTIYNSVSDAILLVAVEPSAEGRQYVITTVNQAFLRLSAMKLEQLAGRELRQVLGAKVFHRFVRHCTRVLALRQPVYYEQEIALERGVRMFDTTLTPVFDVNGECTHILMAGHDITKRIRAEQRILAKYRENKQLMKQINEQNSALMDAIVHTQEEERRRIALDLHDGLAQMLSVARMNFSSFESQAHALDEAQQELLHTSIGLLDTALRELSLVSYNLMPNTLYDFGLIAALEDMFHMINRVSAVRLAFHTHDYQRLHHQTEIILYRIIQELVNNAFRHSGASDISVQIIMHYKRLVVVVDDNGSGFSVEEIRSNEKSGRGLQSVETRVQYLDGSMIVDSHVNSGTVVAVEIPLTPASYAGAEPPAPVV